MSTVHDLAVPLDFDGPQASHFGAPRAAAVPLRAGAFVGDTRQGGSCNCATLTLTPHCNGTHTESRRHLDGDGPAPFELLGGMALEAWLVTVTPTHGADTDESTDPPVRADDRLVTAAALERDVRVPDPEGAGALIVRTRPNDPDKRHADWRERPQPFFTNEAMHWIAARFGHLLFDGPSLDRAQDDGKLSTHRILWTARPRATVTEMIFVPDAAADGAYRLVLQVPALVSDAVPSRPLIERIAP